MAYDTGRVGQSKPSVLSGVRVIIDGRDVHQSAVTDDQGRATFGNLPPGQYNLSSSLEGYVTRGPIPTLTVQAKGCIFTMLALALDRRVTGRVLTAEGEPAVGVRIETVPLRPRHEYDWPMASESATTDANGRYEIRYLPTGDYYLGISIAHAPNSRSPYTRWFYPGSESPMQAAIVRSRDFPESQSFDLALPPPQHERDIQGSVHWSDGRPAAEIDVLLQDPRYPFETAAVWAKTSVDGNFSARILDGTRYRLIAATISSPIGAISSTPVSIVPDSRSAVYRLVLTQKGYLPTELNQDALDHWRKGLGLQ
jgi:hypothetical protein